MKYGLYVPNFDEDISVLSLAELAEEAERAGWDGFFIWDHILYSKSKRLPRVSQVGTVLQRQTNATGRPAVG